MFPTHED